MHWQLNLVTGNVGTPHAVLIRAVEPLAGLEAMARRRGMAASRCELTNGPGKLCSAFGIDRSVYGADLTQGRLFLGDGPRAAVARSPRIGVDYAAEWAARPWRFFDPASRYVSRVRNTPPRE
jgi:DNA-3-methyladenine glycosylase